MDLKMGIPMTIEPRGKRVVQDFTVDGPVGAPRVAERHDEASFLALGIFRVWMRPEAERVAEGQGPDATEVILDKMWLRAANAENADLHDVRLACELNAKATWRELSALNARDYPADVIISAGGDTDHDDDVAAWWCDVACRTPAELKAERDAVDDQAMREVAPSPVRIEGFASADRVPGVYLDIAKSITPAPVTPSEYRTQLAAKLKDLLDKGLVDTSVSWPPYFPEAQFQSDVEGRMVASVPRQQMADLETYTIGVDPVRFAAFHESDSDRTAVLEIQGNRVLRGIVMPGIALRHLAEDLKAAGRQVAPGCEFFTADDWRSILDKATGRNEAVARSAADSFASGHEAGRRDERGELATILASWVETAKESAIQHGPAFAGRARGLNDFRKFIQLRGKSDVDQARELEPAASAVRLERSRVVKHLRSMAHETNWAPNIQRAAAHLAEDIERGVHQETRFP